MKKYQVAIIGTNIGAKHFEDFKKVSDRFKIHTLCGLKQESINKILKSNNETNVSTNFNDEYPNTNEFFSNKEQEIFFSNLPLNKYPTSPNRNYDQSSVIFNLGLRATLHDFTNYLSEDLLIKVDRASMANSIEIRAPFLDKDLVEFAFTKVPSSLKFDHQNQKILLKLLASKVLPSAFSINRKQGFSIPLGNFLHEKEWKEYFAQTILDSDPQLINQRECIKLLEDTTRIFQNAGRLFGLVFYIHWIKRFKPIFE